MLLSRLPWPVDQPPTTNSRRRPHLTFHHADERRPGR